VRAVESGIRLVIETSIAPFRGDIKNPQVARAFLFGRIELAGNRERREGKTHRSAVVKVSAVDILAFA
jgi:hypothetical protein